MGKYPMPDEARRLYESGVLAAKEKWVNRCYAAGDDYQTWYAAFAAAVYRMIPTLAPKTDDIEENLSKRAAPVAKKIREVARAYRKAKMEKLTKLLPAPAIVVPE